MLEEKRKRRTVTRGRLKSPRRTSTQFFLGVVAKRKLLSGTKN